MRKDIRMPKKSRLGKGVGALFPTLPTLDEKNELEARESVNVHVKHLKFPQEKT